jgi:RNA-binding protein YlmH
MLLNQVLTDARLAMSFGEVRTACGLGQVKINGKVIQDAEAEVAKGDVISLGKRKSLTVE